jgi:hypothetical protein
MLHWSDLIWGDGGGGVMYGVVAEKNVQDFDGEIIRDLLKDTDIDKSMILK